jgi:hypothetical protein
MISAQHLAFRTFPALLGIAFLLGSSVASAQFGGSGGGNRQRGGSTERHHSDTQKTARSELPAESTYEQIEYRLTLLEESLKLAPEQKSDWQNFAIKSRAYAADMAREHARNMAPTTFSAMQPSALQHVGHAVDTARNHLTALEEVETATKALLQSLNPTQKAIADMRIPTIVAPRPTALLQKP